MTFNDLLQVPRDLVAAARGAGGGSIAFFAFIIVALAVLLAVGYLATRTSTAKGRIRALLGGSATRRTLGTWVVRGVTISLIVSAFVASSWFLGRSETCSWCHRGEQALRTTAKYASHDGVDCVDCHRPPGIVGAVRLMGMYARWMHVYGTSRVSPDPGRATIADGSCLHCHDEILEAAVTARGIRMQHTDTTAAGVQCVKCHSDTGHPGAVPQATRPLMETCLPCHDGKVATYGCSACHVRDYALNATLDDFPQVVFEPAVRLCSGCHTEKKCAECHKVDMPHPAGWNTGPTNGTPYPGHAREGFANRTVCWRCHHAKGRPFVPADSACSCHGLLGEQHGGEAWVNKHGLQATGRMQGEDSECHDCHGSLFCSACHPDGYARRYDRAREGSSHR